MQIRPYIESDFDQVMHLHRRAMEIVGAYLGNGPWHDDLKDIQGHYSGNRGVFLVGTENGEVIAMGAFRYINDETAEIKRMRTKPELQGRGLGKIIYLELEKIAIHMGYKRIILECSTLQEAAKRLYKSMGFRVIHMDKLKDLDLIWQEKLLETFTG